MPENGKVSWGWFATIIISLVGLYAGVFFYQQNLHASAQETIKTHAANISALQECASATKETLKEIKDDLKDVKLMVQHHTEMEYASQGRDSRT